MDQEEAVDTALANVKCNVRETVKHDRENQRHSSTDFFRVGLEEIVKDNQENDIITEKDIIGLASRVKRRKQATSSDLTRLSNGFLNKSFIKTFMKIPGAINIIIKEFTGKETNRQILSGECLCNLSLGDELSCEKIALYAGAYLLTYTNSLNTRLSATCHACIINLISSGDKPLTLMLNQKLIQTIITQIKDEKQNYLKLDYFNMLYYIFLNGQALLTMDDCMLICNTILLNDSFSTLEEFRLLQKTLNYLKYHVDEGITSKILISGLMKLNELIMLTKPHSANDIEVELYIIRIISNMIVANKYSLKYFVEYFEQNLINFNEYFSNYFFINTQPAIAKELCWLLGNLYNSDNIFIVKYLEKYPLTDLRISKNIHLL